jgi:hypothetical protein
MPASGPRCAVLQRDGEGRRRCCGWAHLAVGRSGPSEPSFLRSGGYRLDRPFQALSDIPRGLDVQIVPLLVPRLKQFKRGERLLGGARNHSRTACAASALKSNFSEHHVVLCWHKVDGLPTLRRRARQERTGACCVIGRLGLAGAQID